jgi:aminoglycoside phosphotransferase (APT) family kinase protein
MGRASGGVPSAALERYLTREIDDFEGPLEIEQFKGGQSNPTYLVMYNGEYVLGGGTIIDDRLRPAVGSVAPGR